MPTATELYEDILGLEDDYYSDEEYDEYDEDPRPVEPPAASSSPPGDSLPRVIETYTCETCQREIPVGEKVNHENSKSHRSIAFEQRVKDNQDKYTEIRNAEIRKATQLWNEVWSNPKLIEALFAYISPTEMLSKRTVCSSWNEYLCNSRNWSSLYYLHRGYELPFLDQCYLSPDFPVVNLGLSAVIASHRSLTEFLERGANRQLYSVWKLFIQVDKIIHEPQLPQLYELIQRCWAYDLRITVAWGQSDEEEETTNAFHAFCERLMLALAANRDVQELRCYFSSKIKSKVNPLRILNDNVRIRLLHVGSSWFAPIDRLWNSSEVEKEKRRKANTYSFDNIHVKELKICNEEGGLDGKQAKYLLEALESNTSLRKLDLSRLNLRAGFTNRLGNFLAMNQTLNELDVSHSPAYINLSVVQHNRGLETLNMSGLLLHELTSQRKAIRANKTLKHLDMSQCSYSVAMGRPLWEALPSGLTHLEMRAMPVSRQRPIDEHYFQGISTHLPHLESLDISDNYFTKMEVVEQMVRDVPLLSTLLVFRDSTFKDRLEFWDLYPLQDHPTLRKCDHRNGDDVRLTEDLLDALDQRLSSRAPRRLTKGAY